MGLLMKCALFLLLAISSGCCGKKYRFDYEWSERADGWLKYHVVPVTWDKARLRCEAEGAILASPLTNELKTAVIKFVQKQRNPAYEQAVTIFTGVHSIFSEGDYSSIEGVPLLRLAITWESGEPDNYDNSERCLSMDTGNEGNMADTRCDRTLPYVCYKKNTSFSNTECGTTDREYVLDSTTGSCYKFHNRGRTWSEAYMTCVAEGGYLAIINDEEEAQVIKKIFGGPSARYISAQFDNSVFVGFHDWNHYGASFRTIHGDALEDNYHSWAGHQPDNSTRQDYGADLGEYCGSVTREAVKLNDSYCNSRLTFLCEKDPFSLIK